MKQSHKSNHTFILTGAVKPYVRMTQRGKWIKPEAQRYIASKAALSMQLRSQMSRNDIAPIGRRPFSVEILFRCAGKFHNKDLDNLVKAVLDSANGIVFADDRWADTIIANRVPCPDGEGDLTMLTVWEN